MVAHSGRDVRFLLSKADLVPQQSHVVAIIGQLLWMLSPIMPSERPPQVFALTSMSTMTTITNFLIDSLIDN